MNFNELRLAEPIVRAVAAKGYTTATPIQAQSIPFAIDGRDILGCAQTGTGKTCAFALPILHRLSEQSSASRKPNRKNGYGRPPRALVLCPTRELAMQIFESFVGYGQNLKLRHGVVFGGVRQSKQVRDLRSGLDVLVATPGRLLDLINQGHIDLSQIEVLVLDEADRMLDMGFINDIRKVVDMIPEDRQTLFFSATVSREIRRLADAILHDPASVETAPESTTAELIKQQIYMVDRENKPELLERVLNGADVGRALIFSKTKHGADKLVKYMNRAGIDAEAIHGDKTQNARTRTMRRFKSGATKVLIATDIASRGIDVDEITHVVNFDMPIDPETYVHRIGRTARAGASGIAISFCGRSEIGIYRSIERRTKVTIDINRDHPDLLFEAPTGPMRSGPSRGRKGSYKSGQGNYRGQSERPGKRQGAGKAKNKRSFNDKPSGGRGYKSQNASESSSKPSTHRGQGGKVKRGAGAGKPNTSGRVHKSAVIGVKKRTQRASV
ncbi:MAG: DEAD/DEAH box helicase [Phycisphaerales bacterium]